MAQTMHVTHKGQRYLQLPGISRASVGILYAASQDLPHRTKTSVADAVPILKLGQLFSLIWLVGISSSPPGSRTQKSRQIHQIFPPSKRINDPSLNKQNFTSLDLITISQSVLPNSEGLSSR